MSKPVVRRVLADRDARAAFRFYLRQAGEAVALRFIDALEDTILAIGRRPQIGSPRQGNQSEIPGLRSRRLDRFPYLVFYVERENSIEVWRILHERRDISAPLLQNDS